MAAALGPSQHMATYSRKHPDRNYGFLLAENLDVQALKGTQNGNNAQLFQLFNGASASTHALPGQIAPLVNRVKQIEGRAAQVESLNKDGDVKIQEEEKAIQDLADQIIRLSALLTHVQSKASRQKSEQEKLQGEIAILEATEKEMDERLEEFSREQQEQGETTQQKQADLRKVFASVKQQVDHLKENQRNNSQELNHLQKDHQRQAQNVANSIQQLEISIAQAQV